MKYIYYIAFVSIIIVLGWVFRPVEEHMTLGTCKRQIYGPKAVDSEKCARVYPEVYGPNGSNTQNRKKELDATPTSTTAMYEDDGEFRSDTATRNAAYMNVFTFKPYAKMDFPATGPPQPYLSDFANFHK
jgi:hypothetical protein